MPVALNSPAGLWLLALLGPLVILYILKVRRPRRTVSSTWLWRSAERDLSAKSPWRRLTPQVPLLLEAFAICALAAALGGVATRSTAVAGDHVALVIDASASMSARTRAGTTRFEEALAAARDLLSALGPTADAMIIEAGKSPRVASALDRDRARLENALGALSVREQEGNLGRSISLAADRLLNLSGNKRIVVVTDGALAHTQALPRASIPIEIVRVGAPVANVAIVRADVQRGADRPEGERVEVFVRILNAGRTPVDRFVTLRRRGSQQPLASRRIRLASQEAAPVALSFMPAATDAGTGLVVDLEPKDAMVVDDQAFLIVPESRRLPVVMSPPGASPWLRRAFEADPLVELSRVASDVLSSVELPRGALVVMTGACPATVPAGDLIVVNPPPGPCFSATVGQPLARPRITSWEETDRRFQFLTLEGLHVAEAHRIDVARPEAALIRAGTAVLAADLALPGRHGTLLGFDPGRTDWPLRASFVVFARNLGELARSTRSKAATRPVRPGEPIHLAVPSGVEQVTVEGPDEKTREARAHAGLAIVPSAARVGFHFVSWQTPRPGSQLLATSLTSEAESDLSERPLEIGGASAHARPADEVARRITDWAWLLALAALFAIVADVWWLTRRPKRLGLSSRTPPSPERTTESPA